MEKKIVIKIGNRAIEADLNNSDTSDLFYSALPKTITMQRWGDEYYGDCGIKVNAAKDARAEMEVGELAIWPDGNALCIFFGPTPASMDDKPRAISKVNPIGKISQDVSFLKDLPDSIQAEVQRG